MTARRHPPHGGPPDDPRPGGAAPSRAPPGSLEKIERLELRAALGLPLFAEGEADDEADWERIMRELWPGAPREQALRLLAARVANVNRGRDHYGPPIP